MTPCNRRLPAKIAHDPDTLAWHRNQQILEIRQTIELSEVRCISFDELLNRIEHLWDDPAASELLYRVCELSLSENEAAALSESVRRLIDAADKLPGAVRSRIHRSVKRILSRLPPAIAAPFVMPWLDHRLKARRQIAHEVLRRSGVPPEFGDRLLAAFRNTGDQECLSLIARNPEAIAASDAVAIIRSIDDDYWKMRVMEALLIADTDKALSLRVEYSHGFVWAAGRRKDASLMPVIRGLFESNSEDLPFVHVYVWALGQIDAKDELARVRSLVTALSLSTLSDQEDAVK